MAYLLPLPHDIQFEIDSMVTSMKMKEVMNQLNEVCEDFWKQTKEDASRNFHTYWMWPEDEQDLIPPGQIEDWGSIVYDEIDHDLYISKWCAGYRSEMCIYSVMTNDPEEATFESLPLP